MAQFKPSVDGVVEMYSTILKSVGMTIDEDGRVSMDLGEGNVYPSTVGDKRLTLPTGELLRSGDFAGLVAFHPMAENIYRGESQVLKKFRDLVNFRLTTIISCLMTELMEIAVNKDYHHKLSPKQAAFMKGMGDVDSRTLDALTKVLNSISHKGEHRLVSIYLKRGGVLNDAKYSRLAVVSFPITEDFDNEEHRIFNHKLRVKDYKAIKALFNYIVPNGWSIQTYSYGSNSMAAPYFHALSKGFIKVANVLNEITKLFKKHLDNPAALLVDTSWEESLEDLSIYRDIIPSLEGNDGEASVSDKEQAKLEAAAATSSKSIFSGGDVVGTGGKLEHKARKSAMSHLAETLEEVSEKKQQTSFETHQIKVESAPKKSSEGLSWSEIMAKRQAAMMPAVSGFQNQFNQPVQPVMPPPGFAGTTFTPQDVMAYNMANAGPGRFGMSPMPYNPMPWNTQPAAMPWNTQPLFKTGI